MKRIRSRGNKDTELALIRVFRAHRITGWRRHVQIRNSEFGIRNFKVRPDFVFPKLRLAVFVDGCFWHGCPQHATKPRNNAAFWRRKFAANKARDRLVTRTLLLAGWRVLRIWEHELAKRGVRNAERGMSRLLRRIREAFDTSPQPSPRSRRRGWSMGNRGA